MREGLWNMSRIATGVALGTSLILLSVLVYTRLTVDDPYIWIAGRSRLLSDLIAFVHFILTLAFWSRASWVISGRGIAGAVAGGTSVLAAFFAASLVTGIELADIIRLYVGRHAWWVVLVLAAGVFPFVRSRSDVSGPDFGRSWWVTAAASFFAGFSIYLTSSKGTVDLRLVEALFVLTIPSLCLISIAIGYQGRHSAFLRALASFGAIVSASVATIR